MDKQLLKYALGWGFLLWLIGYVLGIVLFAFVPPALLGWVISPIGVLITLWVLFKKIKSPSFRDYAIIAVVWTVLAIALDFVFLVSLFKPADGYYKLDVYVYYTVTLLLPLVVGWYKTKAPKT